MRLARALLAAIAIAALCARGSAQQVGPLGPTISTPPLRSKIISFTRDMTAASGNVSYTGVGFQPTTCEIWGTVTGTAYSSRGFSDQTGASLAQLTFNSSGAVWTNAGANIIQMNSTDGAGADQLAVVSTYDADGFTLTWTKNGVVAAGTATFYARCMR